MLLTSAPVPQDRQQIPCVKVDQYTDSTSWNYPFAMTSYACGADFLYGQVGTFPAAVPTTTTTTAAAVVIATATTTTTAALVSSAAVTSAQAITTAAGPTTTTTTTTATTLPVKPTTTTSTTKATKPAPTTTTCKGGYVGTKIGKGPKGACCRTSADCNDTCVKGICGVHP